MLKSLLTLQFIVILLFSVCAGGRAELHLFDLSCENLSNPVGIATESPGMMLVNMPFNATG